MDIKKLQQEAYRLYQLNWMAAHHKSVNDLLMSVLRYHLEDIGGRGTEAILDTEAKAEELCQNWELDTGFDGECWVGFDEFIESEFMDPKYMRKLLPAQTYGAYADWCYGNNT